ncbi:MAG: DHHA1 domain-containing protein [Anaerolineae bacterium]|nr:DHHA1 domain-containing protein [Anaerolineae bacterium]
MTVHLYHSDAYLCTFDAHVVRCWSLEDRNAVVLDQTAFYPTSGGQPHDIGTINEMSVVDVYEENGDIVHLITGNLPLGSVRGQIDWQRRLDHMQQHTGQHILSQAFLAETGAQTLSFHLGKDTSTIDLNTDHLSSEQMTRVEDRANTIVLQNRPVIIRSLTQEEVPTAGLRKPPSVKGTVRVVAVEDFDLSACGGTHLKSTGETGMIFVRRWERQHKKIRVEFLCGWRALRDHRQKNNAILHLAQSFSIGEWELLEAVERLQAEVQSCHRSLKTLREQALDHEARSLLSEAHPQDHWKIVVKAFEGRDPQEVRILALRLVHEEGVVALLGAVNDMGRLFFARSSDLPMDMGELLRETCEAIGSGGGGGRANLAQGGGLPSQEVYGALALALQKLTS